MFGPLIFNIRIIVRVSCPCAAVSLSNKASVESQRRFAVLLALVMLAGAPAAVPAASAILAWGNNSYLQCVVPGGLTNAVAVAAGEKNSVALLSDGTVCCWGDNTYGQNNVPVSATNIMAVSAGGSFALALRSNRTVIAWGNNSSGQTNIPVGLTNVIAISAGSSHALALRQNGTVVGWGNNYYGQRSVPSGLANVVEIGAGAGHSLARRADGSLWNWGTLYSLNTPAEATNTISSSAGGAFNAAVRADGSVMAWGSYSVQFVPPELTNAVRVSAGSLHALAMKGDKTLTAWGWDGFPSSGATKVPYGLTNVQGMSAGAGFNLAINDGSPVVISHSPNQSAYSGVPVQFSIAAQGLPPLRYQWQRGGTSLDGETNATLVLAEPQSFDSGGYTVVVTNDYGSVTSLPMNLTVTNSAPGIYTLPPGRVLPIGWQTTFSPWVAGSLPMSFQWRFNGAPISGATNVSLSLTNLQLTNSGIYDLVASNAHGETISTDIDLSVVSRYLAAWGDGANGQTNVSSLARTNALAITAGDTHSLVLLTDGTAATFGSSPGTNFPAAAGDLLAVTAHSSKSLALTGDGTMVGSVNQTGMPPVLSGALSIALGSQHGLALLSNHTVLAWGNNSYGQTNVPAGLTNVIAICAGDNHSLALGRDGTVTAWGTAVIFDRTKFIPYSVPATLSNVVALDSGGARTLALRADGSVVAWTPLETNVAPVLQLLNNLSNAVAIADGGDFSLALRRDGTVRAFGWIAPFYLTGVTNLPPNLTHVVRIAAGSRHALGIMDWAGPPLHAVQIEHAMPGIVLSFASVSGRTYSIEYTDSLAPAAWQQLRFLAGTGNTVSATNNGASTAKRFFRVLEW
jgi:alpha-tubulin suppressor-like RCC1 family protein